VRHKDAGAVDRRLNREAVERKGEALVGDDIGNLGGHKPGIPVVCPTGIVQQRIHCEIGRRTQSLRHIWAAGGEDDIVDEWDGFTVGCPSSDDLRHIGGLQKGGSGSSVIEIMGHAGGAASDGLRLSGA
jgi:hypothetical protein